MLQIYQKAETVVGWLGAADAKSTLAISCLRNHRVLEDQMEQADPKDFHSSECETKTEAIVNAVVSLLGRQWLGRTWIRQEIYGARYLSIQCGSQRLEWAEFAKAQDVIQGFARLFPKTKILQGTNVTTALYLISEAKKSIVALQNGQKIPRILGDVLLTSRHFGVGRAQDTVYGILGMCAVPSSPGSNDQATYCPRGGGYVVGVDYCKSVSDVYLDAALYLLSTNRIESMIDLWHYYVRSSQHQEGMPTRVTDWRGGVCDEKEKNAIQEALQTVRQRDLDSHLDTYTQFSPLVDLEYEHDFGQTEYYSFPKPKTADPRVLKMSCKFMTYVAYVSDFTLDVTSLLKREPSSLGPAARSIHCEASPLSEQYLFRKVPGIAFKTDTHNRRLAILGIRGIQTHARLLYETDIPFNPLLPPPLEPDAQLALVPATVRKGDLVVTVGPRLLPFLLRPLQSSAAFTGLFPDPDPYEEASHILCPTPDYSSYPGIKPTIQRRSREVHTVLSRASANFGTDYEFHGPVILPWYPRWPDDPFEDMPLQEIRLH